MRQFEVSDRHTTADIGLALEADSLEELFAAGAEGLFAIILGARTGELSATTLDITLRSGTKEQLLVDWLSELIYHFDAHGLVPVAYRLQVTAAQDGWQLRASLGCRPYRPGTDAAEHEIKAVTYYKLKIEQGGGVYRCHVVFDL
jgi:SHS2 domain-containing protein